MIERSAFQTRARTVDHLGREQIADCPTAISELWKNAFDAYARHVELNVFDGKEPVAAIFDDGHGMSAEEFTRRWLVVGTESKATADHTPVEDRNGLRPRPRQGQKGIGRLSCANLGQLLLLVSKRRRKPFVAALVDWRLFENPFLNLSEIFVPVAEFPTLDQVFDRIPDLAASLAENVTGGGDPARKLSIGEAWSTSDRVLDITDDTLRPRSQDILSTISDIPFGPRHFREWSVADGTCDHGTALLMSGINYDLQVHLEETVSDVTAQNAKDQFFETLSRFVDPFVDPSTPVAVTTDPDFSYVVRIWRDDVHRVIVGSKKQFDKRQVDGLEHRIEGRISEQGVFSGRVRAFGEWLPDDCVIEPPEDLTIPQRRDSRLGPLDLYIAAMEFLQDNTTHSPAEFRFYKDLATRYAGFMIFRDGLRVLPYGRTDNDFFDIEYRRSKSAGREFWNHRQMFGRIAVTRKHNPNLKDKAGREGLLDNRAAKTLKALIANILMQSARRYFGSASEIRRDLLPEISAGNRRRRAAEARERLRRRQRKQFRTKLRKHNRQLPVFVQELERCSETLDIRTDAQVAEAQQMLERLGERFFDLGLSNVPNNLGALKASYSTYRKTMTSAQTTIEGMRKEIEAKTEQIELARPDLLLNEQLARLAGHVNQRIQAWSRTIKRLQQQEHQRIQDIVERRSRMFHDEVTPFLHRFETAQMSYADASTAMIELKQRIEQKNRDLFIPYIGALESLRDSIDLEHLATFGLEEISELRTELDRLNSLAQLGIAVEILGHELESYDDIIGSGISHLPEEIRDSAAVKDIELGYEGLTDQLRFLSPLRLAGPKVQRWITGAEISAYVRDFFHVALSKNRISFSATESFERLRVFDQRSRLYPVFINLVNNSIYWLGVRDREDRQIVVDVIGSDVVVSDNGPGIAPEDVSDVVVSDNGPGIAPEDVSSLFSLFFTRKIRGGRGVGLYLCRANLTAGGHRIRYEPPTGDTPLQGANFLMSFKGAELYGK